MAQDQRDRLVLLLDRVLIGVLAVLLTIIAWIGNKLWDSSQHEQIAITSLELSNTRLEGVVDRERLSRENLASQVGSLGGAVQELRAQLATDEATGTSSKARTNDNAIVTAIRNLGADINARFYSVQSQIDAIGANQSEEQVEQERKGHEP